VKRSGRNEPIWVVIHICLETTQGISQYGYLHLRLAKAPRFFKKIIFYVFSSTKSENRRAIEAGEGKKWGGWRGGELGRWGGSANKCIHM
jgi:hypothetical protein